MDSIEAALARIRDGGMVLVVDDEDRENEGDLVMAAELATPEAVNFMAGVGRGLICAALGPAVAQRLGLSVQGGGAQAPGAIHGTAFTESVDLIPGTSTGISAADRALTLRALADPATRPAELARPGHVFPLVARPAGVLERRGHTEASVDLCRLAGLREAAVICEVLRPDGDMARLPELSTLAAQEGMPLVSVAQLVAWRRRHESQVALLESTPLPTRHGSFELCLYQSQSGSQPLAIWKGRLGAADGTGAAHPVAPEAVPLVRLHSECLTGDVFGSCRCDCGEQLDRAMAQVAASPRGAVLYLRQEGRGIGLAGKLAAYRLQAEGLDTWEANIALGYPADAREYWEAAQILRQAGWTRVRLLTNNPAKIAALESLGISVVERVPLETQPGAHNRHYLSAKAVRFGHLLSKHASPAPGGEHHNQGAQHAHH